MTDVRVSILEEATKCLGMRGPEPWGTEAGVHGGASPGTSWCGLFVRAIWRRAGLSVPDWRIGDGNVRGLAQTRNPQPGDLVCWRGANGHQSLFVRSEGGIVTTLDGNTIASGVSGIVAQKRRASSEVLAYYSAPIAASSAHPSGEAARPVPVPAGPDTPEGLCRGIDVSSHQAPASVDWVAAARLGYRYGIVRLSCGTTIDTRAQEHARRIRDAGLVLGAYLVYVPGIDPGVLSATAALSEAARYGCPGDLVPWLDLESMARHPAEPSWSAPAEQLAEIVAQRWGGVAIYLNVSDWARLGRPDWISRHPLACAHYTEAAHPLTAGGLDWAYWQHRVAPVPGVSVLPIDQSVARLPLLTITQAEQAPRPAAPQRIELGSIPIQWDRAEHDRLRNLAVARGE